MNDKWVWSDHIGGGDEQVQVLIWTTVKEHPEKDVHRTLGLFGDSRWPSPNFVYAELILPREMVDEAMAVIEAQKIEDAQQQYMVFRSIIDRMEAYA